MQRESVPLLTGNMQSGNNRLVIKRERELWVNAAEEDDEDEKLLADVKKRSTSLTYTDAAILILQVVQLYCTLMSLSLRWTWPKTWLIYTRWILFVNLDVWDFLKLNGNDTYKSVQSYHTPSTVLPIAYWHLLLIWGVLIFLGLLAYIIAYACIRSTHHPYLLVKIAKLQRVYLIFFQVFAIPFGVLIGRVFHCDGNNFVDIDNGLVCYMDHHWAYITPVCALAVLLYIVFPIWMIFRTKTEILSMPADRHEAYLQLKETEYAHRMDIGWIVGHFHIFSSFRKRGAYFRAAINFCIFVILVFYAVAHSFLQVQAICICGIMFIMFVAFVVVRPFRLSCFNAFLCFSFLVLTVDALLGGLLSSFNPTTITSVWLTPTYMLYLLGGVNGLWVVTIVIFIIYIISRQVACCPGACKCCSTPLWPTLSSNKIYSISPNTRRFVRAILKGRIVLDRILQMHPLFAPAHELGRQIHIINAYCREAEYLRDPIQNSLWDLLDELIEAHSRIAPKSLFAESVKDSIRSTAAELMRMMPMFTRRLAQREYDFLLMRPVKRRLLLKMYCMGLFLNNRRDSAARHRMTQPYLQKVWKPLEVRIETEELPDDGYYEDMYPEYTNNDDDLYRPETAIGLDLMGFGEFEIEEEKVTETQEETEIWTKEPAITPVAVRPVTATTYTNLVFENDDLSSDEDTPMPESFLDDTQDILSQKSGYQSRMMSPGARDSPVARESPILDPRVPISPLKLDKRSDDHSKDNDSSEEKGKFDEIIHAHRSESQMESHDQQPYGSHDKIDSTSHDLMQDDPTNKPEASDVTNTQEKSTDGYNMHLNSDQRVPSHLSQNIQEDAMTANEGSHEDDSQKGDIVDKPADLVEPTDDDIPMKGVTFNSNVNIISVAEADDAGDKQDDVPKDFAV